MRVAARLSSAGLGVFTIGLLLFTQARSPVVTASLGVVITLSIVTHTVYWWRAITDDTRGLVLAGAVSLVGLNIIVVTAYLQPFSQRAVIIGIVGGALCLFTGRPDVLQRLVGK